MKRRRRRRKEEEEEEKGPASAQEPVRVRKVVLNHNLYTVWRPLFAQPASCVSTTSAICTRVLSQSSKRVVVHVTVVMDTGVAHFVVGSKGPASIFFGKKEKVCLMSRVTGTQAGKSYGST